MGSVSAKVTNIGVFVGIGISQRHVFVLLVFVVPNMTAKDDRRECADGSDALSPLSINLIYKHPQS
jgi:hypothetical protein